MAGFSTYTLLLSTILRLSAASPLFPRAAPLPPVVEGASPVTDAVLKYSSPLSRDGGGGGTIAGQHIINFSDTITLDENNKKKLGFFPFVSNTIATTSEDGKTLTDYGVGYAKQCWPVATEDSPVWGETSETALPGHRTAIWPNANIVTGCNGQCGYTVSNVYDITLSPYTTTELYSTIANITIGTNGPEVNRIALKMWYPNEINYGSFGVARALDGTKDIYLFANPPGSFGVKVARVPEALLADKASYKYWNGKTWAKTAPSATDASANILNYNVGGFGPGTGDVFWSAYYHTWLAVFNDALAPTNTFRLMYSTNGNIVGPWSTTPQDIYQTEGCTGYGCTVSYNYATHTYHHIDHSGKTILLGWTFNGEKTQFTTITFK